MFHKSNVFNEKNRNGWFYGSFIPEGLAKDNRVEIKLVKLNKSFSSKPHFNRTATKIDLVLSGSAIWEVDGQEVTMAVGDYLIIPPATVFCIKQLLTDEITVQTIKIPSIPDDTVFVTRNA